MTDNTYTIRTMARPEVDLAIEWAAQEGWNPGLHDADCFYAADPSGYFVGLLDDEPIACISAVSYGETFGFIGFYIVRPEFRGRGHGIRIWQAAMDYLGERNIGLDGVVAQQENYKKSGFQLAYRNIRYQGITAQTGEASADIVALADVPFSAVEVHDAALFPAPRPAFLTCWIAQPESHALGVVDEGRLAGYGVIRRCGSGYKIGPLFADDAADAERLFAALQSEVEEGQPVFLDTPEVNPAAVALAESHGMAKVFETARMYTKGDPGLPVERVFGVTTFELG